MSAYILTLRCNDRPGIVAAVSSGLFESGGNITEAHQFNDVETGRFFMRVAFDVKDATDDAALTERLARIEGLEVVVRSAAHRKRALILVSRQDHCLSDLLYRTRIGEMNMQIVGVVSNHPLEALNILTVGDVPFHYLPVSSETRSRQEHTIKQIVDDTGAELVILARYMQVLSSDLAGYLTGKCINIHHSFLPGFKGAQPYHQAHRRGVKIIGATAHYVTGDLDEGPIIEQDVVGVSHSDTPDALIRKGRDVERRVLSRAVIYHLQDRVLINGAKTVVFRS